MTGKAEGERVNGSVERKKKEEEKKAKELRDGFLRFFGAIVGEVKEEKEDVEEE